MGWPSQSQSLGAGLGGRGRVLYFWDSPRLASPYLLRSKAGEGPGLGRDVDGGGGRRVAPAEGPQRPGAGGESPRLCVGLPVPACPFSAACGLRTAPAFARNSCPFGNPRDFVPVKQMGGFRRGLGRSLGNSGGCRGVRCLCFICSDCLTEKESKGASTWWFSAPSGGAEVSACGSGPRSPAWSGCPRAWFSALPWLRWAWDLCVCGRVVSLKEGAGWSRLGPQNQYSLNDSQRREITGCRGLLGSSALSWRRGGVGTLSGRLMSLRRHSSWSCGAS